MRRGGNEEKVEREERHCLVWQLVESGWTIRSYQIQRYREGGGRKEEANKPRSPSSTLLIPSSSPFFYFRSVNPWQICLLSSSSHIPCSPLVWHCAIISISYLSARCPFPRRLFRIRARFTSPPFPIPNS